MKRYERKKNTIERLNTKQNIDLTGVVQHVVVVPVNTCEKEIPTNHSRKLHAFPYQRMRGFLNCTVEFRQWISFSKLVTFGQK